MTIQDAIKISMQTEKDAMDFYRVGATHMDNPDAKKLFELLAKEEREHAGWFYSIYRGNDIPSLEQFLETPPDENSNWIRELRETVRSDFTERKAMELAMNQELKLEENLRKMAEECTDQAIKDIYLKNANSTHRHYEIIESEYARLMGMVHETDIDTYVRE